MDNTDYSKYKVLIVDDIPVNVLLIKGMIQGMKFNLLSANSGQEAIEKATAERPDVILMDVMMPGMNGYDCTRALRANPITENIPVIIVSALTSDSDMKEGLAAGANDFLTKPIIKERIVNCILNQISLSKKGKQKTSDPVSFNDKPMRDGLTALLAYLACSKQEELKQSTLQFVSGVPMSIIDDTIVDTLNSLAGTTDVDNIERTLSAWATQHINEKETALRPVQLHNCMADAVSKFRALMNERNLTASLNMDDQTYINTDPELFWATFINMMICACAISSDCTINISGTIDEGLLTLTLNGRDTAGTDTAHTINRQMAVVMAERLNGALLMEQPGDGTFMYQLIMQA